MIKALPNPRKNNPYFITHRSDFLLDGNKATVKIVFIPDKEILDGASYNIYLENVFNAGLNEDSLEVVAAKIIEDLSNELIPYWISIRISIMAKNQKISLLHKVVLEDRQLGWDNPLLLSRLRPL